MDSCLTYVYGNVYRVTICPCTAGISRLALILTKQLFRPAVVSINITEFTDNIHFRVLIATDRFYFRPYQRSFILLPFVWKKLRKWLALLSFNNTTTRLVAVALLISLTAGKFKL